MTSLVTHQVGHFIDGRFVQPRGKLFDFLNPSTNETIGAIPEGSPEDVDRAVRAAARAFKVWGSETSPEKRADLLFEVAAGIEKQADGLARSETLNTGIPISQTRGQIQRAAENFRFFGEMATKLLETAFPVRDEFLNYTLRRPVGVAGLITPWNTPLMLESWKVAPCLAAGDTCVLKPAEWTPLSANTLATIITEAGVPDGVFNVVHGLGEVSGAALVAHPGVKLISFTGETTTGQEIMKNGSSTLKRFSMELGGKNPAIVFEDADLERSLDAVIFMAYSLNGERCTSNSRLLVQKPIYNEFVGRLTERVKRIRVGDPSEKRTELGPLVHPDHWKRVVGYIELGEGEGAKLTAGGKRPPRLRRGNFLEPTLLTDAKMSMRVAREEIFGPVLAVMKFDGEEDAVKMANDVAYGLTGYVWSRDGARAQRVSERIEAGMVWINSHNVRDLRTPFGGVKNSGIGREGGTYSFDFFTETKTVHVPLTDTNRIPTFAKGEGRERTKEEGFDGR